MFVKIQFNWIQRAWVCYFMHNQCIEFRLLIAILCVTWIISLAVLYLHILLLYLFTGHEVVVLKKGCRICGSGGAVATAPLVQSKSYFEIKIQQSGHWSVGLATLKADLNTSRGGKDNESWCLGSDNIVLHDNAELHKLTVKTDDVVDSTDSSAVTVTVPGTNSVETGIPTEGDIIGIAYDHVELNFYLNGKNLEVPVLGVKGTVYPVLFGEHYSVNVHSSIREIVKIFSICFQSMMVLFWI